MADFDVSHVRWGRVLTEAEAVPGPNERCIELPLALEHLALEQPGVVLDAGCALIGKVPASTVAHVVHLTQNISSETVQPQGDRLSFLNGDLRDLHLFANGAFDRAVCVSTLEHVGCDNRAYHAAHESCPETSWLALREFVRVSRAWLLTVPFAAEVAAGGNGRWRPWTASHVGPLREMGADVRFYQRGAKGWYGGGPEPSDAPPPSGHAKVNQILCARYL